LKYLLIILIIFLALAPLTHFLPSKRQRKIARMREYAATHGLFVEFRGLPGRKAALRGSAGDGQIIYYGKRFPAAHEPPVGRSAWLRDGERWIPVDAGNEVPECLQELPLAVLAASIDEGSCGIYWDETGVEEEVGPICAMLERWAGELRPSSANFS